MKRVLPALVLAALALTGSAAATVTPSPPTVRDGSAVGGKLPIRVIAEVSPPVQLFGNSVTATVTVLADRKFVDPTRLRLHVGFLPYRPIALPVKHERETGRLIDIQWTWTLRCLTVTCVPIVPPSDTEHVFHFEPARVDYLRSNGKAAWAARARFPAVEALSEISPGIVAFLRNYKRLEWQYDIAPPAPSYRVSPALVFWLALALAAVCAAGGITLVTRWVLRFRSPTAVTARPQISSLERALALFFWAGRRGDETLQRKALERVAAELPPDVADLSDATRELAWSPDMPEVDEVEAISAQAGVLTHHENGAGQ